MGRLKSGQGQLFYEFHLSDAVPKDHLVRKIDTALDLSWLRNELAHALDAGGTQPAAAGLTCGVPGGAAGPSAQMAGVRLGKSENPAWEGTVAFGEAGVGDRALLR
jgi:hypothetical protein